MTGRRKDYRSKTATASTDQNTQPGIRSGPVVVLSQYAAADARNPTGIDRIDLAEWQGRGVDDWIASLCEGLIAFIRSGTVELSPVVAYGDVGAKTLLDFLTSHNSTRLPATPQELERSHVERCIAWLKLRYPHPPSARSVYHRIKSMLVQLGDLGHVVADQHTLFPRNPFPGSKNQSTGASPLSPSEMERLAAALKTDVADIHHGRVQLPGYQRLTAYLLIVAMRSGANATPLIELRRDCLKPHPLPNMRLMEMAKYRGKKVEQKRLRQPAVDSGDDSPLPLDGVAILEHVLRSTSTLVEFAPAHLRDRMWLYRTGPAGSQDGEVAALTMNALCRGVDSLVVRHALLSDDGQPLVLNLSRLRKTLEHRLWRLSDGDLTTVAALMNQTIKVADRDYLRLDDRELAEAAVFIADELTGALRSKGDSVESGATLENTPAGRCRNTLFGDRAPKDGTNHCDQFVHCFGCPSFAIVGTVADLHRLFSYQEFLRTENAYFGSAEWDDWRTRNERIIAFIDRFVVKNFARDLVAEARQLCERQPHRFWAIRMEQAQSTRAARGGTANA